jgi:hypothetical protein
MLLRRTKRVTSLYALLCLHTSSPSGSNSSIQEREVQEAAPPAGARGCPPKISPFYTLERSPPLCQAHYISAG